MNELQEVCHDLLRRSGAVGMQISVIRDGRQIDFVGGLANAELEISMLPDTVVQVGSVTKLFNAALIMALIERGELDLDAPVIRYLPELRISDAGALEVLSLRHLLSMS